MSDIVKKGFLDVKRRNLLVTSSYKKRFIVLRNSSSALGKVVEIWESEDSEKEPDRQPLGEVWSVQDKPSSSKRYAFQLIIGDEVALTFGCASFMEREEWTKAFNIFKKMAPPIGGQNTPTINEEDFFSVYLLKNPSSLEISHSGQYLLSIRSDAICLHWRTGAIAHHWPRKYVQELSIRTWNIVLRVSRIGGSSSSIMEFEFRAPKATAIAILKQWNMVLMESIALSSKNPDQMNYIGKVLSAQASESPEKRSKSFRKRSQSTKEKRSPQFKRSGSFNNKSATMVNRELPSLSSTWSQTAGQFPQGKTRVSADAPLPKLSSEFSKETPGMSRMQSSPPPLPPRPILDGLSSDEDDPDYAYIEDSEIEGPKSSKKGPKGEGVRSESPSVDEQLLDIVRSMRREKKEKRKKEAEEKRRAATVAYRPTRSQRPALSLGPPVPFAAADPEDYIEPLLCAKSQTSRPKSTGDYETPVPVHKRSCSEPDNSPFSTHKSLSQPSFPLSRTSPRRQSPTEEEANRPALPPRFWHGSQPSEDPNISPYPVVRQILPGKILEEPTESKGVCDHEAQSVDQKKREQPQSEPPPHSEQSSTEPAAAPSATTPPSPSLVAVPPSNASEAAPPSTVPSSLPPSSQTDVAEPPPLPPRSPIKEKLSWGSSTSSVTSNHSHSSHSSSTRCSKCQRRKRPSVEKTMSEHRMHVPHNPSSPHSRTNQKGSLPDLNTASVVPENSLQRSQHSNRARQSTESHSSSDGGSNSSLHSQNNSGYLEIVADSSNMSPKARSCSNPEEDLQPHLHMLDEFMQYFDNKVSVLSQSSTTLPHPKTDTHKPSQLQSSLSQNPASFHSLSSLSQSVQLPPQALTQMINGHVPGQRVNGVKHPSIYQRSQTAAGLYSPPPSSHPPSTHPTHPIKSMSFTNHSHAPPPPVPPRSDVSLGQSGRFTHFPANHVAPHARAWVRTPSTGSAGSPPAVYGNRTRQSSSSSVYSGSPSPTSGPHPRSFRNLARHFAPVPDMEGSSTVFFHHLKQDRRVMHSHMV